VPERVAMILTGHKTLNIYKGPINSDTGL